MVRFVLWSLNVHAGITLNRRVILLKTWVWVCRPSGFWLFSFLSLDQTANASFCHTGSSEELQWPFLMAGWCLTFNHLKNTVFFILFPPVRKSVPSTIYISPSPTASRFMREEPRVPRLESDSNCKSFAGISEATLRPPQKMDPIISCYPLTGRVIVWYWCPLVVLFLFSSDFFTD